MNTPVIGIIENMSGFKCPHCNKTIDIFKKDGGLKTSKDFNIPFLGKIPLDPEIVESGDSGKKLIDNGLKSDAVKAFEAITERIVKNIENSHKKGVK